MRRAYYGAGQYSFGPSAMTPAVKMLLWANVGAFLLTALAPPLYPVVTRVFGLTPQLVLTRLWIWQPVTYMFLHGGITHILFNMLILWMFGVHLERIWGRAFSYATTSSQGSGLDWPPLALAYYRSPLRNPLTSCLPSAHQARFTAYC